MPRIVVWTHFCSLLGRNCPQQCKSCFNPGIRNSCPKRKKNRIVGGEDAPKFAFPWIVQIQTPCDKINPNITAQCGGTLISKKFVASAYHCFYTDGSYGAQVSIIFRQCIARFLLEVRSFYSRDSM